MSNSARSKQLKMMIPGPVQPEESVLKAMGAPVQPHYGPAFRDLYNETVDLLKPIFGTRSDVFILVGSGSAANDACIGSLCPDGKKILIGINGFFGERLGAIAENYHLEVIPVMAELDKPLRPEDFADALRRHPDIYAAALVHLETSTTIINPIAEIGQTLHRFGVPYIVDAVSSLGGMPIEMENWSIDFCASASQKCLGAPPGLAPVAVSPRGWELIERNKNTGHGWYLNLGVWRQFAQDWGDWHPFPVTMASNNIFALNIALHNLATEGISSRMRRFRELALKLRAGLRQIGMLPFTPDEILAPILTGAYGPPGIPTSKIIDYMAEIHNIKIAGGLGPQLKDKIFRIGHMAPSLSEADIDEVIDALAGFPQYIKSST